MGSQKIVNLTFVKLILASTSPRRQDLLKKIRSDFEVVAPQFEETPTHLPPDEEALFFAEQKAKSVAPLFSNAWIIGSDTLVACEGRKLGKPDDEMQARETLRLLSGRTHVVYTALVLLNSQTGEMKKSVEQTSVTFKKLTVQDIEDYLLTKEPFGKAGAYAIQGIARKFIQKVDGDEDVVIGLPVKTLSQWLVTL